MLKYRAELILVIILIPILAYVIWQAYNTYFKPPAMEDIEELEKLGIEEAEIPAEEPKEPLVEKNQKPEEPSILKGILDYTGYTERDPLRPSLPVKEKIEKSPELLEKGIAEGTKKEIVLPTFTITGIVWGKSSPRAIIDNQVYKIGDIIKGAKILDITEKGIYMIYEEREFWVNVQLGG